MIFAVFDRVAMNTAVRSVLHVLANNSINLGLRRHYNFSDLNFDILVLLLALDAVVASPRIVFFATVVVVATADVLHVQD